jgi:hypothetical protein
VAEAAGERVARSKTWPDSPRALFEGHANVPGIGNMTVRAKRLVVATTRRDGAARRPSSEQEAAPAQLGRLVSLQEAAAKKRCRVSAVSLGISSGKK